MVFPTGSKTCSIPKIFRQLTELSHFGVSCRHATPKWLSSVSCRNIFGIEQVFDPVGNTMERTAILTRGDFGVSLLCADECVVFGQRNDRSKLVVEAFDATEIDVCKPLRSELLRFDPTRKLRDWRKSNRIVR